MTSSEGSEGTYCPTPEVLFLTYEEMKADLPGVVGRVAAFLGRQLTVEQVGEGVEGRVSESAQGTSASRRHTSAALYWH